MADEDWVEVGPIPLGGRIELLRAVVGVGSHTALIDPEDDEDAAGVENIPLVSLDLAGHLHPGGEICIPVMAPFVVSPASLDELIAGLIEARDQLDARFPHRERRSPQ